jgi:UDP-N-acetylmuramate: L-alanyl-gamma-D-glutamyl-meso-diaminopimelate ligase
MGCWTPVERFGLEGTDLQWRAKLIVADGSHFQVLHEGRVVGEVRWSMLGRHNVLNGLAALAAAHAVGVDLPVVLPALAHFVSVKRRLELLGEARGVAVYDDFAHHPTAIRTTLEGLRARVGRSRRIVVAMEPRSNSMRLGAHSDQIAPALDEADCTVFLHRPELAWDAGKVVGALRNSGEAVASVDALIARLRELVRAGDHLVFMSNGGFEGAPRRALAALDE